MIIVFTITAYNRNRDNRNRRRLQDRDRQRDNRKGFNDGRDNRQIYNQQGSSGERIILIGRGTRPQSSQSRPPRGGGRGRGYGGRGRGGNPGGFSTPREMAPDQDKGENSSNQTTQNSSAEESRSAPPRGQRSPRRGGRGRGGGRGGGAYNATQATSVVQSQDHKSNLNSSSHSSVNPGTETTGH